MSKKLSVADIVQLISAVSIAIGIVLVIYEIRQAREFAMTQIAVAGSDASLQAYLALAGEDPDLVLNKACVTPDEITAQDFNTLDAIFSAHVARAARDLLVLRYSDLSEQWLRETAAASWLERLFLTEHGRWWWEVNKKRFAPRTINLGDSIISELNPLSCADYAKSFENLNPFELQTTLPRVAPDSNQAVDG